MNLYKKNRIFFINFINENYAKNKGSFRPKEQIDDFFFEIY